MAWVTVDAAGSAQTITPGVITTHGQLTTISDAPSELRSTATYTLSPSGQASTYTGLAPVASATGEDDSPAGVFLACNSNAVVEPVKPFCLPRTGSELHPGRTYYTVTWSPAYFSPPTLNLTLQALISNPAPDSPSSAGGPGTSGFVSALIPASAGFYALHIPTDFLRSRGSPARLDMTLSLSYTNTTTTNTNTTPNLPQPSNLQTLQTTLPGPTVSLTETTETTVPTPLAPTPRTYPNIVPILLPILGAVAVAASVALCALSWRRGGRVRRVLGGKGSGRGGDGDGQSQSQSQSRGGRVVPSGVVGGGGAGAGWGESKSETEVGIQLTDRASWSPTGRGVGGGGRNVFREEIERQERLR